MSRVQTAAREAWEQLRETENVAKRFVEGYPFEPVLLDPVVNPTVIVVIEQTIEALLRWQKAMEEESR